MTVPRKMPMLPTQDPLSPGDGLREALRMARAVVLLAAMASRLEASKAVAGDG